MTLPSSSVVRFLCLAVFLGTALGLTVGPVHLANSRYITYSLNSTYNNSLIVCDYSLDEGERVTRVVWQFFEDKKAVGEYVWSPRAGGNANGRLEGVVNLTRTDAGLQLTELRYNLSGDYSCRVELSSGEPKETEPWELIIVDVIGASHLSTHAPQCRFRASYKSGLIFPAPTVAAGMYSESHGGFLKEVTASEWMKIIQPNNSMQLSFANFTYEVNAETPEDAYFTVTWGMTKKNGEYFEIGAYVTNSSTWSAPGCPELMERDNKEVSYFPGMSKTCHAGRLPATRATITCRDGFRGAGEVQVVRLECDGSSLTWKPLTGETAVEKDLVCVEGKHEGGGGRGNGSPQTTLLSSSVFVVSFLFLLLGYK